MPEFMDVHQGMTGMTQESLREAHNADLAIQGEEGVDLSLPGPIRRRARVLPLGDTVQGGCGTDP